MPKYLRTAETEERGILCVKRIVLDMHFIFRELSKADRGIDAIIELTKNGEATARYILVQLKAGSSYLRNKTPNAFDVYCKRDHLICWRNASNPVLLIVHDPTTEDSWWKHIQGFVKCHPKVVKVPPHKINYHKLEDLFTAECAEELTRLMKMHMDGHKLKLTRFQFLVAREARGVLKEGEKRELSILSARQRSRDRQSNRSLLRRMMKQQEEQKKIMLALMKHEKNRVTTN